VSWGNIKAVPAISGDTSSDQAFNWAAQQFKTCLEGHKSCRRQPHTKLPTRILELSSEDGSLKHVQLVETHGECASYACLSHCWGAAQLIKTTKLTMRTHKNYIDLAALPPTFLQAMEFIWRLGIRYLWIDSLCIIQDDPEDWQRESGVMCSVYQNSMLTIAATKSPDSRGGCFTQALPDYFGHVLRGIDEDGAPYEIFVRRKLLHWGSLAAVTDTDAPLIQAIAPLLRRGWVYQERLLSPRVLHFGSQELLWECSETFCCECSSSKAGAFDELEGEPPKILHAKALAKQSFPVITNRWRFLVMEYSGLSLTFPSDRLPALSGLAKEFMQHRSDQYLAGMWMDSMVKDLTWHPKRVRQRPKKWRAPTWSWASVDSAVNFEAEFKHMERGVCKMAPLCKVLGAECTPSGSDTTGEVLSGYITISGHAIPMVLEYDSRAYPTEIPRFSIRACSTQERFWFFPDYTLHDDNDGFTKAGETVYCLKLATSNYGGIHALVLRCINKKSQTYERIGFIPPEQARGPPFTDEYNHEDVVIKIV
jgi:Heterokaryon incompatibility protein (HET)